MAPLLQIGDQAAWDRVRTHYWDPTWVLALACIAREMDEPSPLLDDLIVAYERDPAFHNLLFTAARCASAAPGTADSPQRAWIITALTRVSRSPVPIDRIAALDGLQAIGLPAQGALEALAGDADVGPEAIRRLIRIGALSIGDAMADFDDTVRSIAASVLSEQPGDKALALLNAGLSDPSPRVVEACYNSLRRKGEAAVDALSSLFDSSPHLFNYFSWSDAFPSYSKEAVEFALKGLRHVHDSTRIRAIKYLAEAKASVAVDSIGHLATQDSGCMVRNAAISALGQLGGARSVGTLLALLAGPQPNDVSTTVAALETIAMPEAVSALITALRCPSGQVRDAAARALARIGGSEVTPILLAAIKDPSNWAHREAIRAVGEATYDEAVATLVALLDSGTYDIHSECAAIRALGLIGGPIASLTLIQLLESRRHLSDVAGALALVGGPHALRSLRRAYAASTNYPDENQSLAKAIAFLDPPRTPEGPISEAVLQLVPHDARAIQTAMTMRWHWGLAIIMPLLVRALAHRWDGVYQSAAAALQTLGPQANESAAVDALLDVLDQDNHAERPLVPAIDALAAIGDSSAVGPLWALLQDGYAFDDDSAHAFEALTALCDSDSLIELLAKTPTAASTLGGAKALTGLAQTVRTGTISALSREEMLRAVVGRDLPSSPSLYEFLRLLSPWLSGASGEWVKALPSLNRLTESILSGVECTLGGS